MKNCAGSEAVISLDLHSGFGMRDRIWFPFSFCKKPFDQISQVQSLIELFEDVYPYHVYQIEPQSKGYLLNGDVWDYLFLKFQKQNQAGTFLPLTLTSFWRNNFCAKAKPKPFLAKNLSSLEPALSILTVIFCIL